MSNPISQVYEFCAKNKLNRPVNECHHCDKDGFVWCVSISDQMATGKGLNKKAAKNDAYAKLYKNLCQTKVTATPHIELSRKIIFINTGAVNNHQTIEFSSTLPVQQYVEEVLRDSEIYLSARAISDVIYGSKNVFIPEKNINHVIYNEISDRCICQKVKGRRYPTWKLTN